MTHSPNAAALGCPLLAAVVLILLGAVSCGIYRMVR